MFQITPALSKNASYTCMKRVSLNFTVLEINIYTKTYVHNYLNYMDVLILAGEILNVGRSNTKQFKQQTSVFSVLWYT